MDFHNAETAENARFVGDNLSRENVSIGKVRCERCGYVNTVAVLPWSPQVAKVRCAHQNCGYVFVVHSEGRTAGDALEEAVDEQYARAEQRSHPKAFSKAPADPLVFRPPSRGSAGANLTAFKHEIWRTPLGPAAILKP